jgi:DNA polymerase-3 subunit beta
MAALPAEEFSRFAREMSKNKKHLVCKEASFKTLVSKVNFCAATDESRPILKGCLLEVREGILYATALDGFRMACSYCQTEENSNDLRFVCPARTLTEISRLTDGEGELEVYTENNLLSVTVKDTTITFKLYAGEFVKKENIFPIEFTTKVTVKKSEICSSVERASVLIRGEKDNLIQLDIKNGKIVITANSEMGKVEESVDAELDGKELSIAMNGKFLMDAMKALEEEKILLSFNTSVSPFTVTNLTEKRDEYLILPVRKGNTQE